ncbi:MAG TPA: acetyltransferase [Acidimicrobiia bacterium]|nr:acetyltransferase [Acidimicrobiia bacterium]
MTAPVAVYGAGGFAREVAWLIEACEEFDAVCFIDDDPATHGATMNGIRIMSLDSARATFPDASVVGAVGTPSIRERVVTKAEEAGMAAATIIHPRTELSRWVEVGEGTVICAGNILTTNIRLGRHVQINLDCTVGHDVIMDAFTTLAPGVHVSGWVHLGRRVYVGTGATFVNGTKENPLVVGDDAVIGAGACVTRSVASGSTVVGVPAKPLTR